MKDSVAVSVQNASKRFRLFRSPKERIWEAMHPFKKTYGRDFWALKDISFDLPKGMTLGIMGRNGSGKSTLLQMICSVLKPTSGTVRVEGRISALLELGSGFNPEFTGRDNVLLNGALMGFSRQDMQERLPPIEAFADIGDFFDQPVRIYSSGMFVRLAFAAAIHVDPDILIVDEALAVGDAKFQHKCYQKFIDFQKAGKTILFVSHSTDAIIRHCHRALLLENGALVDTADAKTITHYYLDLLFTGQLPGYAHTPTLVMEGVHGFNVVHRGMKYYAFSQSLGPIDLTRPQPPELARYIEDKRCFVGSSLEEVKAALDQMASPPADIVYHDLKPGPYGQDQTELERFLEDIPDRDHCSKRKSYNKNEYRYGDKRAEIIDYLVVCGDKVDPFTVISGATIDIYVKAIFHQDMADPRLGNAVKTIDGFLISGSNTWLSRITLPCYRAREVVVWKMTMGLCLNAGDWFIDLGVAENSEDGGGKPADTRCAVIHLYVEGGKTFTGAVDLDMSFSEIAAGIFRKS